MRYVAVFPTLSSAQRGARLLSGAAVPAEAIKVDSSKTRRGCSWGVAFPENMQNAAKAVFANAGITVREYIPEASLK